MIFKWLTSIYILTLNLYKSSKLNLKLGKQKQKIYSENNLSNKLLAFSAAKYQVYKNKALKPLK